MKRLGFKWLFLPFSRLYGLIMAVRNWLYDSQLLQSKRPEVYSISVGNLTVGGTGKTPMIEFLIKRYMNNRSGAVGETATLSRGYGRQTKGFRIATDMDTAETIGDEPLQLYHKFKQWIRVCVGERRVDAIQTLLQTHPDTSQILLDDAFQHRAVRPHLSILLMDYNRPFYEDYPFPVGRLRESRHGARRADVVVVTKCPNNLWSTEQQRIINHIRPYTRPDIPIFFAGLKYSQPVSFTTYQPVAQLPQVILVSGLANADPLEQYVRQTFTLTHHYRFSDHYVYSRADLDTFLSALSADTALLTTEKDWVKLDTLLSPQERMTSPLFYLPVAVQFLADQEQTFIQFLDDYSLKNR
ncbi:tetraacyldisaccharide 4'-kinase [Spirosoma sp.]|uniref:tetraacyldisaccharide 4'-kinase n=1 Tax=Spirosoma sp. TaxID=1899569 RepID=UPI003B3A4A65